MNLIYSIRDFLSSLALTDFILLISMNALIILIVIMIYIVRTEKEEILEETLVEDKSSEPELDLASISEEMVKETPNLIELSSYEEDQEKTAIISYEELLSHTGKVKLNYEEEDVKEDLTIKKVDMVKLSNDTMELPKIDKE